MALKTQLSAIPQQLLLTVVLFEFVERIVAEVTNAMDSGS
jgi:hypothetical protein